MSYLFCAFVYDRKRFDPRAIVEVLNENYKPEDKYDALVKVPPWASRSLQKASDAPTLRMRSPTVMASRRASVSGSGQRESSTVSVSRPAR